MSFLFDDHFDRHQDLHVLEERALLAPGAAVIADNVLKPGAPRFLWKLRSKWRDGDGDRNGEIYHLQILSLQVAGVFFSLDLGKLFVYRSKPKKTNCQVLGIYLPEWLSFFFGGGVLGEFGIVSFQGLHIHLICFEMCVCVCVGSCFSMVTRRVLTASGAVSGKT